MVYMKTSKFSIKANLKFIYIYIILYHQNTMHANHIKHFIYHIYSQLKWKHAYKISYLHDDNDNHIYKTCEDLRDLDIRKPAHISSINLQVECAPLRKSA